MFGLKINTTRSCMKGVGASEYYVCWSPAIYYISDGSSATMFSLLRSKYGFIAMLHCIIGLATAGKACAFMHDCLYYV